MSGYWSFVNDPSKLKKKNPPCCWLAERLKTLKDYSEYNNFMVYLRFIRGFKKSAQILTGIIYIGCIQSRISVKIKGMSYRL